MLCISNKELEIGSKDVDFKLKNHSLLMICIGYQETKILIMTDTLIDNISLMLWTRKIHGKIDFKDLLETMKARMEDIKSSFLLKNTSIILGPQEMLIINLKLNLTRLNLKQQHRQIPLLLLHNKMLMLLLLLLLKKYDRYEIHFIRDFLKNSFIYDFFNFSLILLESIIF